MYNNKNNYIVKNIHLYTNILFKQQQNQSLISANSSYDIPYYQLDDYVGSTLVHQ